MCMCIHIYVYSYNSGRQYNPFENYKLSYKSPQVCFVDFVCRRSMFRATARWLGISPPETPCYTPSQGLLGLVIDSHAKTLILGGMMPMTRQYDNITRHHVMSWGARRSCLEDIGSIDDISNDKYLRVLMRSPSTFRSGMVPLAYSWVRTYMYIHGCVFLKPPPWLAHRLWG